MGVLNYREVQRRKAESTATAAAESKNTSYLLQPIIDELQLGREQLVCSRDGCTNIVVKGGVRIRHGAKRKCRREGCANNSVKGGVCIRHGESSNNVAQCRMHKLCSERRSRSQTWGRGQMMQQRGVCKYSPSGGVCKRHGATKFRYDCSAAGCTNKAQIGGVCIRHGANGVHATDATIVA